MKAIWIDAENGKIVELEINEDHVLSEMQFRVGGLIERACGVGNGDHIYVDEEGLFKNYHYGFMLLDFPQHLVGNGIIVNHKGDGFGDCNSTIEMIKKKVIFLKFL